MIGQTLAHYKILEKIGSGGMGDVYLAEDTKLDRKVALKVLPPELAESEERRARFQREAKAIAALDHPNIVQVFSVEEAEGIHFMQVVVSRGFTPFHAVSSLRIGTFYETNPIENRRGAPEVISDRAPSLGGHYSPKFFNFFGAYSWTERVSLDFNLHSGYTSPVREITKSPTNRFPTNLRRA